VTSLTSRLYSLIAILLGAGLLAAGIVLDRDSRLTTIHFLESDGRHELALLRVSAPVAEIRRGNIAAVDAWCDRAGEALDRRVTVIESTGRVLGDSRVPLDSIPKMQNHADRPEVRAALRTGVGESTRQSWTIRQKLFYIAEPLEAATPGAGSRWHLAPAVLRIAMPVPGAYEFGRRWQRHLWIGIAAVFALVLGGGYVLGRRVDRRLRRLRESAEALGSGDLAARVPVDSHDELAALGRILNSMAERLAAKLSELQAERDGGEAVLANLSQGIALLTPDLSIRHANDRFWEIVGTRRPPGPEVRLAATRQPVLEEIAAQARQRGTAVRRDVSLYVGGRGDYEISVSPIRAGAESGGWLLSIEDLKPERTMAKLRREFVANVSHELRTPLTSIRGYAETLLQGGLDDEENRSRFVDTIRKQAVRLESLVEDLLELADLERPDTALDLKDWDVAEVVRDLAAGFEELANRRGLSLELDARPGIHARMDRKRIEVAVHNLIENAIKYTDSGTVRVAVRDDGGWVLIAVQDTGRGVEPEHVPRLFERFYRVDRGRARAEGGTGLGLSIVKHAIELHRGRVSVESTPGRGSTFRLEFPRAGPPQGGSPAQAQDTTFPRPAPTDAPQAT